MSEKEHIDQRFRDQKHDWDGMPSGAAWERLTDKLDQAGSETGFSRSKFIRPALAASVVLLLGFSVFIFNKKFGDISGQMARQEKILIEQTQSTADKLTDTSVPASIKEKHDNSPIETDEKTVSLTRQSPASIKYEAEEITGQEEYSPGNGSGITGTLHNIPVETTAARQITPEMDEVAMPVPAGNEEDDNSGNSDQLNAGYLSDVTLMKSESASAARAAGSAEKRSGKSDNRNAETDYYTPTQASPDRSMTILYPYPAESECDYLAIHIISGKYYIDKCQFNNKDMDLEDGLPLAEEPVLEDMLDKDRNELQDISNAIDLSGCPWQQQILIYINDSDQPVTWKLTGDCKSRQADDWINRLSSVYRKYQ